MSGVQVARQPEPLFFQNVGHVAGVPAKWGQHASRVFYEMYESWRQKIRDAEEAFESGRFDKACQLVVEGNLRQYVPGQLLVEKLVKTLVTQSQKHMASDETKLAWRSLDSAISVDADDSEVKSVRKQLIEQTLNKVESALAEDNFSHATSTLEFLQQRNVNSERYNDVTKSAYELKRAKDSIREGEFEQAADALSSARQLLPHMIMINQWHKECQDNLINSRRLKDQLHRALLADDWDKSLDVSDQLLEIAPECKVALDARRRAWEKVGAQPVNSSSLADTTYWSEDVVEREEHRLSSTTTCLSKTGTVVMKKRSDSRFLLWVDAVGGYMVCLGQETVIGQAMPDSQADVPILGDLHREHIKIIREGEDYIIEPLAAGVSLNGKSIDGKKILSDADEIGVGKNVLLRFRRPHALSVTARIEFASRHRTQPWADGVLLMAESCVLGPNWNNHVVCRDWADDVVLFRQDHELHCRAMHPFEIDGKQSDGSGLISYNSRIVGDDFSMSLEAI